MTANRNFAGWASLKEYARKLDTISLDKDKYEKGGVIIYGNDREIMVDTADTHSIIFGATGSMKTRRIIMPSIFTMIKAGESFVVSDPKGEIFERTAGEAHSNGFDVKVFNLRDYTRSNYWNPLSDPYFLYKKGDYDGADKMISEILNVITNQIKNDHDPFWELSAKEYLRGAIMLFFEIMPLEKVTLSNIANFLSANSYEDISRYEEQLSGDNPAVIALKAATCSSEKTGACYSSVALFTLSVFKNHSNVKNVTSSSEIDFPDIGKKKTAVYIIVPDEDNSTHFFITMMVSRCYSELIAEAEKRKNRTLPVRVNFVLDEFCNIPVIQQMPSMTAAARSRNIRFVFVCQNYSQLMDKYYSNTQTIIGNCTNIIFLVSSEQMILDYMVRLCGKRKRADGTLEALVTTSNLQKIDTKNGEVLIKRMYHDPLLSHLPDIDEYATFKKKPYKLRREKSRGNNFVFSVKEYASPTNSFSPPGYKHKKILTPLTREYFIAREKWNCDTLEQVTEKYNSLSSEELTELLKQEDNE